MVQPFFLNQNTDAESTANKLKAIEMYGRNLDLWKQNIVIEEKNNSSTEVETRLREKLGKLLEKQYAYLRNLQYY